MSIELSNGVILPDIPSDVLAQYPYFLITHRVSTTSLSDNYNFFAFNDEKPLCVGVDLSGGSQPILVAYAGTSYTYNSKALKVYSNPDYGTSDTEWSGVTSYTMSRNGFVNFLGSDGVGTTRVVASNFDIYNAATYEGHSTGFGDMTFTPGTEVYFTATHQWATEEDAVTDKNKFLGVDGTERLIDNICSLIDAVLPSDGTTGQILMIGADGNPVWADAPTGGAQTREKDVIFIDYDGTILYSYTVDEAQALTELPPLPSHAGLICQGWNFDLETIKAYNREIVVGATYITDDGTTRIYITLQEGRTSPMLGVCPNGTVTVDWGDGTAPDVLTGTSTSTVQWTPNHEYAKPGDYVIRLTVDGEMGFAGESGSGFILRQFSSADNRNKVYLNSVKKLKIGNGVASIGDYSFCNCYSLASVTIPKSVTSIGRSAFSGCYSLASVTIPESVTSIGDSAFIACYSLASVTIPESVTSIGNSAFFNCYSLASVTIPESVTSIGNSAFLACYSLASVTIPESVTSIGDSAFSKCNSLESVTIPESVTSIYGGTFYMCYSLASVTIPESVTSIGNSAFYNCYSLASVTIPESVTSIGSSTFSGCYGIRYYDFTSHTAVPTLQSTSSFPNMAFDCEIRVPAALYDEWIAATNWATYASQIVAV